MKQDVVLHAENITKTFPGVKALSEVSFDLVKGEVHALCGENGAGKSTLIKTLSGIWTHGSYEGSFYVDGEEAKFQGINDAEAAGIAVIYQELALVNDMTVAENIYLGHEPTKGGLIDWNKMYMDASELLRRFNIAIDPTLRVGDIGVGKQQLVEIVKALRKESHILILDEPTAALTEHEVDILIDMLRELKTRGIACIYISHKLDEVFTISDRITVLRDGKTIQTMDTAKTTQTQVIKCMVGREIDNLFPRRQGTLGESLLEVSDLSVKGPEDSIDLEGISFSVRRGEVLGLGGLMGAGRTEVLMHIMGAYGTRLSGTVALHGAPYSGKDPKAAIDAGMVLVSEDRKRFGLVIEQSNNFNFSLSSIDSVCKFLGLVDVNKEFRRNEVITKQLRVKAHSLEVVTGTLSGGNQQKVVLGKALLSEPEIIFLDEPTRGIDVGAKLEVYELINRLTDEGKAVIIVSSELPELMGMSDRIIMLSEGRLGGEFTKDQFNQEALISAAIGQ
ncbi:ATP-binding cassette domain-containing protein [Pelagicoccus sp. SDUM812002]|uniref:sugar ABC transporter ATP-binding protein n=1 Tax=Pelagicoccus sp. SDUM812002 TaxID=3041266 RepID=UPI00280E4F44|nr:ATP-binding cassette domain-containing protein [Pelagicoccus sp. SDUM812002]MDQ8186143.1 sugar ABC transporter ATP-binding protein [Pelagicoccus sp. SDUM812002]